MALAFVRNPHALALSGSPLFYEVSCSPEWTDAVGSESYGELKVILAGGFNFTSSDVLELIVDGVVVRFKGSAAAGYITLPTLAAAGSTTNWLVALRLAIIGNISTWRLSSSGDLIFPATQLKLVPTIVVNSFTLGTAPANLSLSHVPYSDSYPENYRIIADVRFRTPFIECGRIVAYPIKGETNVTFNLRDIVYGKQPRAAFGSGLVSLDGIQLLECRLGYAYLPAGASSDFYGNYLTGLQYNVMGGEFPQQVVQDDGSSDTWINDHIVDRWLTAAPTTRYVSRKMRMAMQVVPSFDIELYIVGIPDDRPEEPDDHIFMGDVSALAGIDRVRMPVGYQDILVYGDDPPPPDWLGYKVQVRMFWTGSLLAPELTFMFREPCDGARVLQFRNSLEAFDTVLFTSPAEYGLDIAKEVYVTGSLDHAPQGDTARFASRDQLGVAQVQTTESITVRSEFLTEEQMKWLRELMSSDEVYEDYYAQWLDSGGGDEWYPNNLRPVIIRPGSIKWYTEQAATTLYQLELTYEYSGYTNQHYAR